MNINDKYTVTIEKLINEGKALARINNTSVFIEGGCPGDKAVIEIKKINKNFLCADIVEIVEPSKYRVIPRCPFHNICGSCNWLHIDYKEQLKQKKNIVYETLNHIAGINCQIEDIIASPKIEQYRCKVQYPVTQTKVSKRLLSGYYKKNTHELINIKYCIMQPVIINEINEFVKSEAQKLNISGYNEKNHTGLLKHIIYRMSSDIKQILIIFVVNDTDIDNNLYKLAEIIMKKYDLITGICVNFNNQKTNVIMGNKTKRISGNDYYIEVLSGKKYKISAESFFQVNPYCAEKIFDKVKELITKNIEKPSILDAYSGVSSFGIWLKDIASSVTCIEEVKSASKNAIENIKLNSSDNITIMNGDAGLKFKELIDKQIKFDVSIIDPPRKGCSDIVLDNLVRLTSKYIVYVSCNISTLARDIKILKQNNFEPQYIQPVDMFPNTYHIETIVLLKNSQ